MRKHLSRLRYTASQVMLPCPHNTLRIVMRRFYRVLMLYAGAERRLIIMRRFHRAWCDMQELK